MLRPLCMFGEKISYRPIPSGRAPTAKLEPRFEDGIFLGIVERTGEVIVANDKGFCLRCRDFKRRPAEERWDKDMVLRVVSLPWATAGAEKEQ